MSEQAVVARGERRAVRSARRKGMRGSPGLTLLAAVLAMIPVVGPILAAVVA